MIWVYLFKLITIAFFLTAMIVGIWIVVALNFADFSSKEQIGSILLTLLCNIAILIYYFVRVLPFITWKCGHEQDAKQLGCCLQNDEEIVSLV